MTSRHIGCQVSFIEGRGRVNSPPRWPLRIKHWISEPGLPGSQKTSLYDSPLTTRSGQSLLPSGAVVICEVDFANSTASNTRPGKGPTVEAGRGTRPESFGFLTPRVGEPVESSIGFAFFFLKPDCYFRTLKSLKGDRVVTLNAGITNCR